MLSSSSFLSCLASPRTAPRPSIELPMTTNSLGHAALHDAELNVQDIWHCEVKLCGGEWRQVCYTCATKPKTVAHTSCCSRLSSSKSSRSASYSSMMARAVEGKAVAGRCVPVEMFLVFRRHQTTELRTAPLVIARRQPGEHARAERGQARVKARPPQTPSTG